jgi:hypothetical protein
VGLADLMHQNVAIFAPSVGVSRAGDPTLDWDEPILIETVKGWIQSRRSAEDESLRNRRTEHGRLYVPADADIKSTSRVRVNGQMWQVIGPPRKVFTPRGPHHIEADVEYLDG